jgi:DNA processing protein
MITAKLADSYNRDVFAVPGRTTDVKSSGCNLLIRRNIAQMITCAGDLKEIMGWEKTRKTPKKQKELFPELNAEEKQVLDLITASGQIHIDDIHAAVKTSSSVIAASLLSLEFQHLIRALPGKMYAAQ